MISEYTRVPRTVRKVHGERKNNETRPVKFGFSLTIFISLYLFFLFLPPFLSLTLSLSLLYARLQQRPVCIKYERHRSRHRRLFIIIFIG